jgi:hypothetical protein
MAGLSEEQGRGYLAQITELRHVLDAAYSALRLSAGPGALITRQVDAARYRAGVLAFELQTVLGPQEHDPAEVLELPRRKKKGAHRG